MLLTAVTLFISLYVMGRRKQHLLLLEKRCRCCSALQTLGAI